MCTASGSLDHRTMGPKTFAKLLVPVSLTWWKKLFEEFDDCLVKHLCKPVGGGIVRSWSYILYSILVADPVEWLAHKLSAIVMDDPLGNTKSMYDMVFDEVNNIGRFNFDEGTSSVYFESNWL